MSSERLGRIVEGAILHTLQKTAEAAVSGLQNRLAERDGIKRRLDALEADLAALRKQVEDHRCGS